MSAGLSFDSTLPPVPLVDRVCEILRCAEAPLFAQEIASAADASREEVIACLTGTLKHDAVTDGYCWTLRPSPESENAFQELLGLADAERWWEFDALLRRWPLRGERRAGLLALKKAAILKNLPIDVRPDDDQLRILALEALTVRVTARAGSGKTHMLHALVHFLVASRMLQPDEVLLLAFNRNAAEELERRLSNSLDLPSFSGVRTFHSLAHALVQPAEALLMDEGRTFGEMELTAFVQRVLTDNLDEDLRQKIYQWFKREAKRDISTGALLGRKGYYAFRRDVEELSLSGQYVKSRGEKYIADFLFEHGIEAYYEERFWWNGGWYRPDFKIKTTDGYVILEHWALDPDSLDVEGSPEWSGRDIIEYRAAALEKRAYWKAKEVPLIETVASEASDRASFEELLRKRLEPHCGPLVRLPQEQLEQMVVRIHQSTFSEFVSRAIQRAQKLGFAPAEFAEQLKTYKAASEKEEFFLSVVARIFSHYVATTEAENRLDFDQLLSRAIAMLRADPPATRAESKRGTVELDRVRFCLVDEAQDLSPQFVHALEAIREFNPAMRILFVGDDWQAINRFAGSRVDLFTQAIERRFKGFAADTLRRNYRSASQIVQAGNALMVGRGEPATAVKGTGPVISGAFYDSIWIELREGHPNFDADEPFRSVGRGMAAPLIKCLYQLAVPDLLAGKTVGVLFRNNRFGLKLEELTRGFLDVLRRLGWSRTLIDHCSDGGITFSTAHRFKGDQRDTIFIVAPHTGQFPLIRADSIELFRFFGDSLEQAVEDERRLFYVALTRAKNRLVFVCERQRMVTSPFLEPLAGKVAELPIPSELLRPAPIAGATTAADP